MRRHASSTGGLAAGLLLISVALPSVATAANGADDVSFTATLSGRTVAEGQSVQVRPVEDAGLQLHVVNGTDQPLDLRKVKVTGGALGMDFFDFGARVRLRVPAHDQRDFSSTLDLSELGDEATGLLPARVQLLGDNRHVLAERPFTMDVDGRLGSAYGIFGISVAVMTALLLGAALVRLAMGQLPANRWFRAVRFAVPGVGVGLTLSFTLSALRVLIPSPSTWTALVLVGGLAGLVLGFVTPTPGEGKEDAEGATEADRTTPAGSAIDLREPVPLPSTTGAPSTADLTIPEARTAPAIGYEGIAPHPPSTSAGRPAPARRDS
jgi:hypothetical protein